MVARLPQFGRLASLARAYMKGLSEEENSMLLRLIALFLVASALSSCISLFA
jgi:hypothetical protein